MTAPKCWLILCTNSDGKKWWHAEYPMSTRKSAEWMINRLREGAIYPRVMPKMEPVEMVPK